LAKATLVGADEHDRGMDSPVSLRYPNGRIHETSLATSEELKPGDRFELYGRHWNAVVLLERPRWKAHEQQRMLCLSTSGMSIPTK
jgi:hypothetical protein